MSMTILTRRCHCGRAFLENEKTYYCSGCGEQGWFTDTELKRHQEYLLQLEIEKRKKDALATTSNG